MAQRSDVDLLQDLLAREHRLLSAYEAALRRDAIDPALGRLLAAHERAHVAALEQALAGRGNPVATVPAPDVTAALRDRRSFAEYAMNLEGETVGFYSDSVPRIRDPKLRRPLGSIMTCGAAHVVALKDSVAHFLVN
jgi:ferritin-like protein